MTTLIRGLLISLLVAVAACTGAGHDGGSVRSGCDNLLNLPVGSAGYCERRDFVNRPTLGRLSISSRNGEIDAEGQARSTVTLLAYVYARAATEQRARQIVSQVQIHTEAEEYYATGPTTTATETWGVSFEASLPQNLHTLTLNATNGDLTARQLAGTLRFTTTNGNTDLGALAGDLGATVTNGSMVLDLVGGHWNGTGVDLQATNGDLAFFAPGHYAAHVSLTATNGRTHSDFAGGTRWSSGPQSHYEIALNGGGALLRGTVTNGDAALRRKP